MERPRRRRSKVESISGKSSKRPSKKTRELAVPEPKVWLAINRGGISQRIVNHIGGEAEDIVTEMIGYAKGGNFQAMKYLFEMAGLFPATAADESALKDTLTTRLRDRMEKFVREANRKLQNEPGDAVSVP